MNLNLILALLNLGEILTLTSIQYFASAGVNDERKANK